MNARALGRCSSAWCFWLPVVGTLACSDGHEGDSVRFMGPPLANFGKVAESLDYTCGNLACHGSPSRNLRIYGDQGRRLDVGDVPCGDPTTPAEVETDYRSLVGLEPEVMDEVVAAHGEAPERLTLVRKARGTEQHAGGAVLRDGTDRAACADDCADNRICKESCYADRCLVSWIAGKVDVPACGNSLPETRCNPAL